MGWSIRDCFPDSAAAPASRPPEGASLVDAPEARGRGCAPQRLPALCQPALARNSAWVADDASKAGQAKIAPVRLRTGCAAKGLLRTPGSFTVRKLAEADGPPRSRRI